MGRGTDLQIWAGQLSLLHCHAALIMACEDLGESGEAGEAREAVLLRIPRRFCGEKACEDR